LLLKAERHRLILQLVLERSIASIGDPVEIIGACDATLRRDVNALAAGGQVGRIRDGAEALNPRQAGALLIEVVGLPAMAGRLRNAGTRSRS